MKNIKKSPIDKTGDLLEPEFSFKRQGILLVCMYLGYAGFLLLKTSVIMIGPALLSDPILHLSKTNWGAILGCGTIGGILGKFLSGWSSDRIGGKKVFTIGLLLTTIGVCSFSFQISFVAFAVMYFIIIFANASGWPSMAKLIGNWFSPNQYGRVWGLISTSSRAGTITATLSVGGLLQFLNWQQVLWVTSGVGIFLVLLAWFFIKEYPTSTVKSNSSTLILDDPYKNHPFFQIRLLEAFYRFLKNKRFLLISGSMMGLTILWDFLNFVPIYLNESLHLSSADAALATSSFPIGSLVSVLVGGFLFDKLPRKKITRVIGIYLGIAVLSLMNMMVLPQIGGTPQFNIITTLISLFIFGFTVSPAYYLPMSIFSIEFGGPHSGFLIALLDAVGFAASVAFSFAGGHLASQTGGWNSFLSLLICIAIFSWVITVWFLNGEANLK